MRSVASVVAWRERNPDYFREYAATHSAQYRASSQKYNTSPRGQYASQRRAARRRGVDWDLTFDEWLEWWGPDLENRGKGYDRMCMARYGDEGPYALWNIYKSTGRQNFSDYWTRRRNAQGETDARKQSAKKAAKR